MSKEPDESNFVSDPYNSTDEDDESKSEQDYYILDTDRHSQADENIFQYKIFSDKTSHDIPNERLATSANYAANEALITDKVDFDDEIEDVTPPDMKAEWRTGIFRTFRNGKFCGKHHPIYIYRSD